MRKKLLPNKAIRTTALLGLATGTVILSLLKTIEFLMLINFFSVLYVAMILFCFAFGLARSIDINKTGLAYRVLIWLAIIGLAAASLTNRDFTSLALGTIIYYPVPLPRGGLINQLALAFVFIGGPALFFPAGSALAIAIRNAGSARRSILLSFFGGQATGFAFVHFFSYLDPFLILLAGLALLSLVLLSYKTTLLSVIALAGIFVMFTVNPARTFFLWGITNPEYLGGGYGRDVKVDFVSFFDDSCLGVVIDNAMMTCECRNLDWIPAEYDYVLRTIVDPFDPPRSLYKASPLMPQAVTDTRERRQNLDVLDVGRSGGSNCRAMEIYTGPNNNTAIEFEPAIVDRLLEDYSEYNDGIYLKDTARVFSGDFRTNLEELAKNGETFDYIFLSGIGTKTYILPRSYVFSEHFLLTEEGTELIFDTLLKPDGIFYLDWGSSSTKEAKWFVASFPEGVSTVVYWTTQSEYPFSGSPQVYVIASRNAEKVKAIEKRIDRLSGFRNVDFRPGLDQFRTTDNRPFLQNDMQALITAIHFLLALLTLIPFLRFRRIVADNFSLEFRRGGSAFWLTGLTAGFGESLFSCFNPFLTAPFDMPAWLILHALFLIGFAIGTGAFKSEQVMKRKFPIAAIALLAAGATLLFFARQSNLTYIAPLLSGSAIGLLLAHATARLTNVGFVGAMAYYFFGAACALLFHKIPFFLGGYTTVAVFTVVLAILALGFLKRTPANLILTTTAPDEGGDN
jgi:hypothetical protein